MMSAFFHDANPTPEHPNRPDHPDFRLMAEVVQDLDAQAELGVPVTKLIGVDEPSLRYLAEQRCIRVFGAGFLSAPLQLRASLMALYWDAFTLGSSFTNRRSSGTETGTAGEGSSS
jgi:hypothetical protein